MRLSKNKKLAIYMALKDEKKTVYSWEFGSAMNNACVSLAEAGILEKIGISDSYVLRCPKAFSYSEDGNGFPSGIFEGDVIVNDQELKEYLRWKQAYDEVKEIDKRTGYNGPDPAKTKAMIAKMAQKLFTQ